VSQDKKNPTIHHTHIPKTTMLVKVPAKGINIPAIAPRTVRAMVITINKPILMQYIL
jgi:hypothetical protein